MGELLIPARPVSTDQLQELSLLGIFVDAVDYSQAESVPDQVTSLWRLSQLGIFVDAVDYSQAEPGRTVLGQVHELLRTFPIGNLSGRRRLQPGRVSARVPVMNRRIHLCSGSNNRTPQDIACQSSYMFAVARVLF
jgi:hypothetical protein